MHKRLFAMVAVAGLTLAGATFAGTVTGTIASVNLKAHSVTLTNGTTYYLPVQFRLLGFKAGDPVTLDWRMKDGMHDATSMQSA